MFIALLILSIVLFLATFIPVSRSHVWFIRDLDFPRVQILIVTLGLIPMIAIYSDWHNIFSWLAISLCISSVLYQLSWVIPYCPLFPKEVETSTKKENNTSISILCSNVLMTNKNAQSLIDQVTTYEPDILVTLETNLWWEKQLHELEKNYPHLIKCPQENLYGMHVYSKLPLENATIEFLIDNEIPSIHCCVNLCTNQKIRMHFLHPTPPSPTENDSSSERDAELIMVAKSIANTEDPIIVTGDLNDVAWSKTTRLFRRLSGLKDPRRGRGMFNTFHADYWFMRWPLDHLFHSSHFKLHTITRLYIKGSDHFALLTKLTLENTDIDKEPNPPLTDDDKALINERQDDQNSHGQRAPNPMTTS